MGEHHEGTQLSQDDFWKQWAGASGQPGEKQPEEEKPAAEKADSASGVDADVLAKWLQAFPLNDPVVPPPAPTPAAPPASPADLAQLWPPAAPVDPFTGIQKSAGGTPDADWDLSFDLDTAVPAPAAVPPPAPAPPASPYGPYGDVPTTGAAPAPAPSPFAPPTAGGAEPAAPVAPPAPASPFGPPPPPIEPPQEALEAPPLRLQVTVGRRTFEQKIQGEALIGRPDATRGLHPEIDLRLDDAVSRRHAKIFVRNGRYVLTDLNSTNGTRYNREWLQPENEVALKAGDEIEVGELTLIRVLEAPETHA